MGPEWFYDHLLAAQQSSALGIFNTAMTGFVLLLAVIALVVSLLRPSPHAD